MSQRSQTLRALVTERLTAAAEEIFVLVERTIAEYEEELCRSKEENQRKQQLLEEVLRPQLMPKRTETLFFKQEQPEHSISVFPEITAVCVKSEESTEHTEELHLQETGADECGAGHGSEGQTGDSSITDDDADWEPSACASAAQMETNAQTTDSGPAALFKPMSAAETRPAVGGAALLCQFCTKTFANKRSLKVHVTVHTGERRFSCAHCVKTFASRGHLRDHMSVHTREKPFCCTLCHKAFTRLYTLHAHTKTHTGESPHICSTCGKGFTRRSHLTVHESNHRGDKPFSCTLCPKRFTRKDHLQVHTKRHIAAIAEGKHYNTGTGGTS